MSSKSVSLVPMGMCTVSNQHCLYTVLACHQRQSAACMCDRGLLYCMEYLEENLDEWLAEELEVKHTTRLIGNVTASKTAAFCSISSSLTAVPTAHTAHTAFPKALVLLECFMLSSFMALKWGSPLHCCSVQCSILQQSCTVLPLRHTRHDQTLSIVGSAELW